MPANMILHHFNPLPPHGGRLNDIVDSLLPLQFQSTPSAWRETSGSGDLVRLDNISIHSLRMEGDRILEILRIAHRIFQSTPSAWRET